MSPTSPSGRDRLEIFGLDLRHTPSVEAFCRELLATRDRARLHRQQRMPDGAAAARVLRAHDGGRDGGALPHAANTCAGCSGSYEGLRGYHLLPREPTRAGPADAPITLRRSRAWQDSPGITHAAELSQVRAAARGADARRTDLFPEGRLDQDLQQVDLRGRNSWRLLLAEVSTVELLEVQLVNAVAPFVFNARLKPLMLAHAGARQAHRQRVGGGGAVLSKLQDDPPSAHEHGEGGAEHDDAHGGDRLPQRRHPHEQRRHRAG